MSTEYSAEPQLPDFDLIANTLVEEGVHVVSPSELHGLICGHLVAGARLEPMALLQNLCDLMDIKAVQHESSKVVLLSLYQQSLALLEAEGLVFELLLPDEDQPLEQRAEALGQWCQGLMAGFGLHGSHSERSLSAEARETLSDLNQIAQIAVDEEDEGSEGDLMQIEEYVRMAALMLFAECNTPAAPDESNTTPTVH